VYVGVYGCVGVYNESPSLEWLETWHDSTPQCYVATYWSWGISLAMMHYIIDIDIQKGKVKD